MRSLTSGQPTAANNTRAAHIVARALRRAPVSWGTVSPKAAGPTGRKARCNTLDLTQHQSTLAHVGLPFVPRVDIFTVSLKSFSVLVGGPNRSFLLPGRLRFAAMADREAVIGCLLLARDLRGNASGEQASAQRWMILARVSRATSSSAAGIIRAFHVSCPDNHCHGARKLARHGHRESYKHDPGEFRVSPVSVSPTSRFYFK